MNLLLGTWYCGVSLNDFLLLGWFLQTDFSWAHCTPSIGVWWRGVGENLRKHFGWWVTARNCIHQGMCRAAECHCWLTPWMAQGCQRWRPTWNRTLVSLFVRALSFLMLRDVYKCSVLILVRLAFVSNPMTCPISQWITVKAKESMGAVLCELLWDSSPGLAPLHRHVSNHNEHEKLRGSFSQWLWVTFEENFMERIVLNGVKCQIPEHLASAMQVLVSSPANSAFFHSV